MNGAEHPIAAGLVELAWRPACLQITLKGRKGQSACISEDLLRAVSDALDQSEREPSCRMVVVRGQPDVFCLGMDFADITDKMAAMAGHADESRMHAAYAGLFMDTLKRISSHTRPVVCIVEGKALGGGVGLAAACDIVVALEGAEFGLPELLWGLLPANIMPFLVRRMGYQQAYRLALTTQSMPAQHALAAGLVDAVCQDPDDHVRRLLIRMARIEPAAVAHLKRYMRKMWIVDEAMEQTAVDEFMDLVTNREMQNKLKGLASLQQHAPTQKGVP